MTVPIVWVFIAFLAGGFVGFFFSSLCVAASRRVPTKE
jgi:hypothetical protein